MATPEQEGFGDRVVDMIAAGYPAIWIQSHEQDETVRELVAAIGASEDIPEMYVWDCVGGLRKVGEDAGGMAAVPAQMTDLLRINGMQAGNSFPERSVILLMNLNMFLMQPPIRQFFLNHIPRVKVTGEQRLIVISGEPGPHEDLAHYFTSIEYPRPNRDKLDNLLAEIAVNDGDIPEGERDAIIDAARGLTCMEAENAFSLSIARDGYVDARAVFRQKSDFLKHGNLGLEVLEGETTFESIGGLAYLKQFYLEMIQNRSESELLKPRGIVLAGVPGTGKSLFCLAAGNSCMPVRPSIRWAMTLTGSKWVSEGSHKMQQVLQILDMLAPLNVQVDEAEKQQKGAFTGSDSAGAQQGTEMLSLWLTWHQESTSDVYPILTMNEGIIDVALNMPEMLARFDEVFFLDFPDRRQKDDIWIIHLLKYGLIEHPAEYKDLWKAGYIPDDAYWVGRDIDKACRQAAVRGIPIGDVRVGVTSSQAREAVERMREFAHGRWMSVEYADFYDKSKHREKLKQAASARRKISRKKSDAKSVS